MTAGSTVAEIEASGGTALGVEVDVRDHEAVRAMVGRVVQEWGRVDVLVADAGESGVEPVIIGRIKRTFSLRLAACREAWRRVVRHAKAFYGKVPFDCLTAVRRDEATVLLRQRSSPAPTKSPNEAARIAAPGGWHGNCGAHTARAAEDDAGDRFSEQRGVPRLAPRLTAFRQGLSKTGYVEGQDVAIEYRWAEGRSDRLPELAADLVGHKVDAIATSGGDFTAVAAKNATSSIPIVFLVAGDPVEEGLVASLAHPGGNLTGMAFMGAELWGKRVELISEPVPDTKALADLVNPNFPGAERNNIRAVQEAARAKGLQLSILRATNDSEIDAAFASLVELRAPGAARRRSDLP